MIDINDIIENINTAIFVISSSDYKINYVNGFAVNLFAGNSKKDFLGKNINEFLLNENQPSNDIFNISTSGEVYGIIKKLDGSTFYGEMVVTDIPDSDSIIISIKNANSYRIIIENLKKVENELLEIRGIGEIVFESKVMKDIYKQALKYHKQKNCVVLIEGETGTGKEIVARLIHYGISNHSSPFVDINCASIPEALFESELFGYDKGAFTGANEDKIGKIELANGGTIFFDEIGEMPLSIQAKLLRVLQEKEYYRLGGKEKKSTNSKFIFATNRNLKELVEKKMFRDDLYYRINIGYIKLPPLRERKEDIPKLVNLFSQNIAKNYGLGYIVFDNEVIEFLKNKNWEGNVRELKHFVEKLVIFTEKNHITLKDIERIDSNVISVENLLLKDIKLPEEGLDLKLFEKNLINRVLEKFKGNKTKAAKYLGLTRSSLRSRL